MHYSTTMIVDKPLTETLSLFDDIDNMKHWQSGLVSYEILNGKKGEVGTKGLLTYKNGMKLTETITVKDLPREFTGTYEASGVWNEVRNLFQETSDGKTEWTLECEFRMESILMKTMATLMPWMFKAQTKKLMNAFKAFAENGTSVLS